MKGNVSESAAAYTCVPMDGGGYMLGTIESPKFIQIFQEYSYTS